MSLTRRPRLLQVVMAAGAFLIVSSLPATATAGVATTRHGGAGD
jgi:hypothetical protein